MTAVVGGVAHKRSQLGSAATAKQRKREMNIWYTRQIYYTTPFAWESAVFPRSLPWEDAECRRWPPSRIRRRHVNFFANFTFTAPRWFYSTIRRFVPLLREANSGTKTKIWLLIASRGWRCLAIPELRVISWIGSHKHDCNLFYSISSSFLTSHIAHRS